MSNYSQSLVYRFNADTAPAKRAMIDMAQSGVAQMALLAGAAAAAGKKLTPDIVKDLPNILAAIQALKLGFLAFGAAAAAGTALAIVELHKLRKIGEDSARAGVSSDFFQRFVQSAGTAKESVKTLEDALNKAKASLRDTLDGNAVGDRLQEFQNSGRTTGKFDSALSDFKAAPDQEGRIKAVAAAMDALIAQGARLAALDIGEKVFGVDGAEKLISTSERVKQSIEEMVNTAADKKVVSAEQIENARKLEERLVAARKEMTDGMRPILEDLEKLGMSIYRGWVNTEEAIGKVTTAAGSLYKWVKSIADVMPALNSMVPNLQGNIDARLVSINSQISSLEKQGLRDNDPDLVRMRRLRDQMQSGVNGGVFREQLRDNAVPVIPFDPNAPTEVGPNTEIPAAFRATQEARARLLLEKNQPKAAKTGSGGSSTDSDLEFYEKYVASIEKAIAALKTETETLGLSTYEREKATLSSKAYAEFKAKDIELSDEQKAKIDQLIEAQARLKAQLEDTKNAMQAQREFVQFLGTNVSSFFSDIVSGGKNAGEAMMNLTKKLADAALQAALLGQGPLAKLFGMAGSNGDIGGIFGMLAKGFSGFGSSSGFGSAVSWGTPLFDVGSQNVPRDMPAFVHQGEMILPRGTADRVRRGESLGPGGGGAVSVTVAASPELDARIASTSRNVSARVVQAAIGENNARIPAMLAENNAR